MCPVAWTPNDEPSDIRIQLYKEQRKHAREHNHVTKLVQRQQHELALYSSSRALVRSCNWLSCQVRDGVQASLSGLGVAGIQGKLV